MDGNKARILFMDDEPLIRDVASEMLRFLGYDVMEVEKGERLLEIYSQAIEQACPFDLVIMDLTIPNGLGAMEVIHTLREMDPRVKAMVSSGWTEDPVIKSPQEYGFIGIIPKPYDIDDMEIRIAKVFES